jgi:hypothetical protein
MKRPKNVFFFTDPIYCQDFMVILSPSHNKYRKIIKKLLNLEVEIDDTCSGCFQALHDKNRGDLGIIWIPNKKNTLVHEIFHATSWVMRHRDIMLDAEGSEEAWAYYIAYLYNEIKEKLK